ncbi:hypothetical protein [Streptomyces sp. NBC_01237]|uniref:hypothetical protein n=1 Tax=Streptomyces sp. NBC_01237 TaxID=2903790 RepID=UPI002DD83F66|nr:hypothetical protein [Streptomyces sp. NBC_01237]WRZ76533.1 hypothetical protein OG251_35705 [Streptomyces sp. NBC_01237]
MERIAASGENLADEPDEWGYDEDGSAVDLRGADTGLDIGSGHVEFVGGMPAAADTRTRWDDIVPDMFRRHSAGPDRAALPPEGVRSREHFMAGLAGADLPSAVRLLCTGEAEGSAETALRGIEALLSMAVTAQDEGHPASGRLAHLRTISRRRAGRR